MQLLGGLTPTLNGEPIDLTKSMTYKGMMFSGIPNFAFTFGYTNASWTLKADLVSEFVCRVLNYMDAKGFDTVVPEHPGASVDELPFMDFTPGYFQRSMDLLPKSGSKAAVAAQAELPARPAAHPSGQGRRGVPALHQTPCVRDGLTAASVLTTTIPSSSQ